MPITELNFWISSNYTGVGDTVGGLLDVRTFNGREWHSHDVIDAKKTTKNLDKKYKFSETDSVFAIEFEYKHRAGSGGLAFDNFVVTFDKKVTYIYQNFEHDVLPADAETDTLTYTLANLQPNSRYFYQLQNSDYGNGCKENFSPLSKAICVVTTEGETSDSKQLTVVNENGIFVVYLPEPQAGHSVYVYDVFGKLVAMIPVENSLQHRVELPKLYDNSFYIVKYAETGKMKRKNQPWSKFFYHR